MCLEDTRYSVSCFAGAELMGEVQGNAPFLLGGRGQTKVEKKQCPHDAVARPQPGHVHVFLTTRYHHRGHQYTAAAAIETIPPVV